MRTISAKIPKKCWVGEQQKVCYATREEAEAAALVAEHDYGAPKLGAYKCEYGDQAFKLAQLIRLDTGIRDFRNKYGWARSLRWSFDNAWRRTRV